MSDPVDDTRFLSYSRFPPFDLSLPIDWSADPYGNRQWLHNFLSLRWLPVTNPINRLSEAPERISRSLAILEDFLIYHSNPDNPKGNHYNTKLGDLACGIRLPILCNYYTFSGANRDLCGEDLHHLLANEIRATMEFMHSRKLMRDKSNHSLGVKAGLLHAALAVPELCDDPGFLSRTESDLHEKLEFIFDRDGIVREHSVHYQTYNAWQAAGILDVFERFNHESKVSERIHQIIAASRRLLPYCFKPDGRYHLVGDTFQRPAVSLVRKLSSAARKRRPDAVPPGEKSVADIVPGNSAILAPSAGFFGIRYKYGEDDARDVFSLFFTACWHSEFHKQADDLSVSLHAGGQDILVDPGYSDLPEAKRLNFRLEQWHNTVSSADLPFVPRQEEATGTAITRYCMEDGVAAVEAEHCRMPGTLVTRTLVFVAPYFLFIRDRVNSERHAKFQSRFHFGPDVKTTPLSDGARLEAGGNLAFRLRLLGPDPAIATPASGFVVQDLGFRNQNPEIVPVDAVAFSLNGPDCVFTVALLPEALQAEVLPWPTVRFDPDARIRVIRGGETTLFELEAVNAETRLTVCDLA